MDLTAIADLIDTPVAQVFYDAQLMTAATSPAALSVPVPEAVKDVMRARILRSMLLCVAQHKAREGENEVKKE